MTELLLAAGTAGTVALALVGQLLHARDRSRWDAERLRLLRAVLATTPEGAEKAMHAPVAAARRREKDAKRPRPRLPIGI